MTKPVFPHDLNQFTGGDTVYKHPLARKMVSPSFGPLALVYTEGVKYLATHAQAYWLIDLIASHMPKVLKNEDTEAFHIWFLKSDKDGGAVVTCKADTNAKPVIVQRIPFTDFPFPESGEFKLYGAATTAGDENVVNLMLPSEY